MSSPAYRPARPWATGLKVVAALVSVFLFVGIAGAYAYYRIKFGEITKINVFGDNQPEESAGGSVNFLLVGTDSGEGLSDAQLREFHLGAHRDQLGKRSDTMILLHVSRSRDTATLVSFPRDSWVTIPAYKRGGESHPAQQSKINAAFAYGGPRLAIKTVEANTGVTINHYVQVNVLGLANIVDALGGVTVCLAHDINDSVGGDSGFGGSGFIGHAGENHLGGVDAVKFARTRHDLADQDIGRIKRQQAVLGALFHEAVKAGTLLNPIKLDNFVSAAVKSVKVDNHFGRGDMITLAKAMHDLGPKHVQFLTVPIANSNYRTVDGQSAVLWDEAKAKSLFKKLKHDNPVTKKNKKGRFANLTIPPTSISTQVLNGTDTNGLASGAASDLTAAGFHISGTPSDADTKGVTVTEVHYGSSRADSAKTLAAALKGAKLVPDESRGASGLAVVLGTDYHGVRTVKVSTGTSADKVQPTTAADKPCT